MKKTGSFIAVTAMIALGALVAIAPMTVPGRAVIRSVGVDTIIQPPSPDPMPVVIAPPTVDPAPATAPVVVPDPVPVVDPTPEYPVVQGAPCLPPGVVVNGGCAVPDVAPTVSATSTAPAPPAPAPVNPAANQPGQGAPCLPPGVLTGNLCAVPQPTPPPAP